MLGTLTWGHRHGKHRPSCNQNMKTFIAMLIASIIGSLVALYIAYAYVKRAAAANPLVADTSAVTGAVSSLEQVLTGRTGAAS